MPSPIRFGIVRKMLEKGGWRLARIRGSHHVFEKEGQPVFVIPVHYGQVKPGYVKAAKKRLEGNPRAEGG